jgi:hypothetical protein
VPDAEVQRVKAEMKTVSERAALASRAVSSPDVSARLDARVDLAACGEELEALSLSLSDAQARAHAARTAARAARRDADRALSLTTEAAEALEQPLTHPLAEATEAHTAWFVHSGLWLTDPSSAVTHSLVKQLLGPTGVGEEVQRDAIAAYVAEDPSARRAGGVDRLPDGSSVAHAPGRPSLVSRPAPVRSAGTGRGGQHPPGARKPVGADPRRVPGVSPDLQAR